MIHHTSTWRSGSRLVALCLALLIMALGVMTASAAPTCTTTCYADAVNGDDTNDGTTAATALKTIQAAVNQVTAGGQVFALAGTYPESVLVNKPVTITGDGPTQTIIDPVAGNGFNISASTVKIEDLKVQGATAHGVVINTPVANTTFDNVHFVSNTSRGIDIGVAGVTNVSVLNSLFDANSTGIRMASAATVDGILIENTTFQNHTGSGFNQANDGNAGWVKNLTVRDSTFTNNGTTSGHAGVYAEEYSNVLIEDSTFSGNQYGINLWDVYNAAASVTTNVIVRNNTFTDHKYATIALQSRTSDPNAQLFLVENNTINQNVGALVGVTQAHLAVTTSSANPNGAVDVVVAHQQDKAQRLAVFFTHAVAVAVHPAGFVQQPPRLVGLMAVLPHFGVERPVFGRQGAVRHHTLAGQRTLDERLPIQRIEERLAHVGVLQERRVGIGEVEQHVDVAGLN